MTRTAIVSVREAVSCGMACLDAGHLDAARLDQINKLVAIRIFGERSRRVVKSSGRNELSGPLPAPLSLLAPVLSSLTTQQTTEVKRCLLWRCKATYMRKLESKKRKELVALYESRPCCSSSGAVVPNAEKTRSCV